MIPVVSADVDDSPISPAPDLAALEELESDLAAVDRALAALDDGSYGRCQVCRVVIESEVMTSSPVATHCGAHRAVALSLAPDPSPVQDPGPESSGSQPGSWS